MTRTSRTCEELGLCQARTPRCPGCTWQLAPGTIDGPYFPKRRRPSRWPSGWPRPQTVVVAALAVASAVALVVTLSAAAGCLSVVWQGGGL